MRWLTTPAVWRACANRAKARFQVGKSVIACSMLRVNIAVSGSVGVTRRSCSSSDQAAIPAIWDLRPRTPRAAGLPERILSTDTQEIQRICRAGHASRVLRQTLLKEIARSISFDAYAWLLTDPETEVGSDPVADVPCMPQLPTLIRLKYATHTNRWTSMSTSVARLLDTTAGNPRQSLVWRELLAAHDVVDMASLVFRDRFGCWAFLDLWRVRPATAFTERDARYLADIVSPVTNALRRAQARTFHHADRATIPDGPAILILSPDLRVRA